MLRAALVCHDDVLYLEAVLRSLGPDIPATVFLNRKAWSDRLVTMLEGANLTTYAWTGYGALESEITGNSTTGYVYNGQDQLAVVTERSGDKTTYSFDGDGLRRSVATTNVSQDPPTLDVTTMVWDGSDYLSRPQVPVDRRVGISRWHRDLRACQTFKRQPMALQRYVIPERAGVHICRWAADDLDRRFRKAKADCCDPGKFGQVDAGIVPIPFPIEKWGHL
jgi:YD repeat-containing protein